MIVIGRVENHPMRVAPASRTMRAEELGEVVHMRQRTARWTLSVFLIAVSASATGAGLVDSAQPADAGTRAPGIECEHITGTTDGVVTLSSCHSAGLTAGTGKVPGKVFISGKRTTGAIRWTEGTHSYSTTVSTTTAPDSSRSYCVRHGYRGEYVVKGKVTASTDPAVADGQSVSSGVCVSSTGVVRQTHYGYFEL